MPVGDDGNSVPTLDFRRLDHLRSTRCFRTSLAHRVRANVASMYSVFDPTRAAAVEWGANGIGANGISAGVTGRDRSSAKSPMKGDGTPDEGCRGLRLCLPPTTRPLSTRHRCRNDCRPITSAKAPHGRENSCRNLQAPSVGQDRGCSPFHAELRRDRLRAVPGAKCFVTCRQHIRLRRCKVCPPERGARISLSPPGTFFSLDFDRC